MTTLEYAVTGDVNDSRNVRSTGIADLNTVDTLIAHVWKRTVHANLAATVIDAAACSVRIELGDDTGWLATVATPGNWYVEVEFTFLDGTVLTWPARPEDPRYLNTSECVLPVRNQGD